MSTFEIKLVLISIVFIVIGSVGCEKKSSSDVRDLKPATKIDRVEENAVSKSKKVKNKKKKKKKKKKRKKKSAKAAKASSGLKLVESKSTAITMKQLQALGYVEGTYDPNSKSSGVVIHDKARSYDGYNLYTSRKSADALLIDMDGTPVHTWRGTTKETKSKWQHITLLPNGDLIVLVKGNRLFRIDKNSNLLWKVDGAFHHDLDVQDNQIAVLSRESMPVKAIHAKHKTLVDHVDFYSLEGKKIRSISILDSVLGSPYAFLLPIVSHLMNHEEKKQNLDILHTNHVEIFDGTLEKLNPIYRKGNILISIRNLNAIAVLNGESGKILWLWGPSNVTFQHHPTLLKNGNILVFNNGVKQSQVLELSPATNQIVWHYTAKDFLTKTRGSNQRLPNGNTLITESDTGYVFEVTPAGEVVWQFVNPVINKKKLREAIWRVERFAPSEIKFIGNS